MKQCKTCSRVYDEDSYSYCLVDGETLVLISEMPTEEHPAQVNKVIAIVDSISELYGYYNWEHFQYDARFDRLMQYLTMRNPDECLAFVRRLLGRTRLEFEPNNTEFNDYLFIDSILAVDYDIDKIVEKLRSKGLM